MEENVGGSQTKTEANGISRANGSNEDLQLFTKLQHRPLNAAMLKAEATGGLDLNRKSGSDLHFAHLAYPRVETLKHLRVEIRESSRLCATLRRAKESLHR